MSMEGRAVAGTESVGEERCHGLRGATAIFRHDEQLVQNHLHSKHGQRFVALVVANEGFHFPVG